MERWRGGVTQVFGHTLRDFTFADNQISAGRQRSLLTGVQKADEDYDQRGRAGLAEFCQSRSR